MVEILDQSGHVERVVAHPGHARSQAARWSPDGSMLAWIGHQGVVVERADGSGKSVLVPASRRCSDVCTGFSFAWSPDSRSLAVGGAGVETNHLLVVAASGGKRVEVAPASRATNYFVVGWMPDGKSLVYERSSGTLGHAGCCRLDLRVGSRGRRPRSRRIPVPGSVLQGLVAVAVAGWAGDRVHDPEQRRPQRPHPRRAPAQRCRARDGRRRRLRSGSGLVARTHASWRSHAPTARS